MTKFVALASLKGGVGKSSLAVNIAGIAATEHRKKVLLVDVDDNRTSSSWFDEAETPFDVAVTDEDAGEVKALRSITSYDLVVVDLPGYRGRGLADVLTAVRPDLILTPSRANRADLEPLGSLVPAFDGDYRIVFTMTNSGKDRDADGYAETVADAGWKLAHTRVRASKGWPRAMQERRLVTKTYAFPTPKVDARALAREVLDILDAQEA